MVAALSPDSTAGLARAAKHQSPQQEVLKQVTSLFLTNAGCLREAQIVAFDGLLVPLIERMDAGMLVPLSEALSTTDLAPGDTIRRLAFHDDPLVAGPVLRDSNRLSEKDLVEIAKTLGQQHLLAISGRKSLNEALTDALMRRGDVNVSNALAKNAGARFSECGYATLVGRAERDESLTERLGLRLDLPANLLREILAKATDLVLARFLTAPRPVAQGKTQGSGGASASAPLPRKIDYTQAQSEVLVLNRAGKLNDSTVNRFAVRGEYTNVVAALSLKTDVEIVAIEPLIESDRLYGLIVACKAARLSWSATTMIIRNRPGCPPATQREFEQAQAIIEGLLLSLAQWTIRFGADRIAAKRV
jgi:hypothetical protein